MIPHTLDEWHEYVAGLAGDELFSQLAAANSNKFARMLRDEGLPMADYDTILLYMVRQCRATSTAIPKGGANDLVAIADDDMLAEQGMTMSVEEAAAIAGSYSDGPDLEDQAAFEAEYGVGHETPF